MQSIGDLHKRACWVVGWGGRRAYWQLQRGFGVRVLPVGGRGVQVRAAVRIERLARRLRPLDKINHALNSPFQSALYVRQPFLHLVVFR